MLFRCQAVSMSSEYQVFYLPCLETLGSNKHAPFLHFHLSTFTQSRGQLRAGHSKQRKLYVQNYGGVRKQGLFRELWISGTEYAGAKTFSSSLPVWRGGGKIWSGSNTMNEEPRQRETKPSWSQGLDWFGRLWFEHGHMILIQPSGVRMLETTVLNKWQGQTCKKVKVDFGNFLLLSWSDP